ncbi:MAG: hypothetical protein PVJ92_00475 [Candidatus Dependentiae bacterium]|jgi:hypothetical protein
MKNLLTLLLCVTIAAPAYTEPTPEINDDEIALETEVDEEMQQMGPSRLGNFFVSVFNAYTWVTTSISDAWESVTNFFGGLWEKTGGTVQKKVKKALKKKKTHPLLEQLKKSAAEREKQFFASYTEDSIPADLRKVAGVIDRFEDDFKVIKRGVAKEEDPKAKKVLIKALHKIDDDVDEYVDQVQDMLMKHQRDSFFTKDSTIFRFVNDLQSRAFVRAMSE